MSFACLTCSKEATPKIGRRIVRPSTARSRHSLQCPELGVEVVGVAIHWLGLSEPKYIEFTQSKKVDFGQKRELVKQLLENQTVVAFDSAKFVKVCYSIGGGSIEPLDVKDPRIGLWMLQPGEDEANLGQAMLKHAPSLLSEVNGLKRKNCCSLSLFPHKNTTVETAKNLACLEAKMASNIYPNIESELEKCGMLKAYEGMSYKVKTFFIWVGQNISGLVGCIKKLRALYEV